MKPTITLTFNFIILCFLAFACARTAKIEGDWSATSSEGDYSELCFSNSKIRIYTENVGNIASQEFTLTKDSLKTNVLTYKINRVNPDSITLISDKYSLNLKRIISGFKLSDFTNEGFEQQYVESFNKRMSKTKGIQLDNIKGSSKKYPKVEEEIIEINGK